MYFGNDSQSSCVVSYVSPSIPGHTVDKGVNNFLENLESF